MEEKKKTKTQKMGRLMEMRRQMEINKEGEGKPVSPLTQARFP